MYCLDIRGRRPTTTPEHPSIQMFIEVKLQIPVLSFRCHVGQIRALTYTMKSSCEMTNTGGLEVNCHSDCINLTLVFLAPIFSPFKS